MNYFYVLYSTLLHPAAPQIQLCRRMLRSNPSRTVSILALAAYLWAKSLGKHRHSAKSMQYLIHIPHSAISHPQSAISHPQSAISHPHSAISHPHSAISHPHSAISHPHSAISHPRSAISHPHLAISHPHSSKSHNLKKERFLTNRN
jgi:hypothetical protein